jgi:hypothetical protein
VMLRAPRMKAVVLAQRTGRAARGRIRLRAAATSRPAIRLTRPAPVTTDAEQTGEPVRQAWTLRAGRLPPSLRNGSKSIPRTACASPS